MICKLYVDNFKDILKKATLNFSIDNVNIGITEDKVVSRMINNDKNAIIFIDRENDFIEIPEDKSFDFNFSEPQAQLVPFLNIIDNNEVHIDISDEKIVITDGTLSTKVFFCSPTIVNIFGSQNAREIDSFLDIDIDEDFYRSYLKIKKIGAKFGKVYFTVKNGKFYIETIDKSNTFSNGLSLELIDNVEEEDLTMLFNFKNFVDLMTIIDVNFKFKFAYLKDQQMGMLSVISNDESEKYYLMSQEEI
jgi:hypothetical protein